MLPGLRYNDGSLIKERVIQEALGLMMRRWSAPRIRKGNCLYATYSLMHVLDGHGIHWQAGSCFWPRLSDYDEDTPDSHFGYKWDYNSQDMRDRINKGELPEVHVWAYLTVEREIVDLTAGEFPEQCLALADLDWPGKKPPKVLWCKLDKLPRGVTYASDVRAIQCVSSFIRDM